MRRVRIQNPLVDKTFKTFLGTDYTTAALTALNVLNSSSFAAQDILVIGEPTEEQTEAKTLSSVTDISNLVLVSTLSFSHIKGTSIYKVPWDYVSIESALPNGTFAQITQTLIQWDNKNNETIYYDPNGLDTTQYRFRFLNSVTALYAEYSPTILGIGFTKAQVGYMIQEVRAIVNDKERKIVSDDDLIRFFNTAQDIIYGHNPKYWFLLVDTYKGSNGIPVLGPTDVYSLAQYTDYGHMERMRFKYVSGGTQLIYDLENKNGIEFDSQVENLLITGNDYTSSYKLLPIDASSAQGYIQIYPKPINSGIGTLYPSYYKVMPKLSTIQDSTIVPLPQLLENYAVAQTEKIKGNDAKVQIYEDAFFGIFITRKGFVPLTGLGGLSLLDMMDDAQKRPAGQPRSLSNFRGQKAIRRLFENRGMTHDQEKEWYL